MYYLLRHLHGRSASPARAGIAGRTRDRQLDCDRPKFIPKLHRRAKIRTALGIVAENSM